ncbi:HNH endonuclease signature motif containing protein [Nocardioides sp. NPDC101246]|uniref:HNH endonuclease signature motif containing protein n=1 Tax=Nocardioides sp. NPDC101246 TaxID=3364336 RepID=UPI0037F293FB
MAWRKYTQEMLQEAVDNSTSVAGVLRHLGLNQAGGTHAHISRMLKKMGIDTSHFVRYVGTGAHTRHSPAEICAECGCGEEWRGQPLRLHIDHVDGDFHNNVADNLRFLCPNCHSQTPNFSGASRGKYALVSG